MERFIAGMVFAIERDILLELKKYIPIAEGIVKTFGDNCEVVIHNLQYPERSLVYVAGNITNRKPGAPVTNIVLEALRANDKRDFFGYKTQTKDGKQLKSSTIFIRNAEDEVIGCLCINIDITQFQVCSNILEHFISVYKDSAEEIKKDEYFGQDIGEVIGDIMLQVINASKIPVNLMQKEDKIQIVNELDRKGVFLVKGAVEQVAVALGVSRYTIYNYLEEIRVKSVTNK